MKILAFSDLHRDLGRAASLVERSTDADLVVGAGDFASVHEGLDETIEALSAIDQQFMASQRQTVEGLANKLGRSLSGATQRDLDTLQLILDRQLVAREDVLTQQALGVVLGDLLGAELNMEWVVYRDRAGRSRALRYLTTDVFVFPVTLISRRWSVGSDKAVAAIYQDTVDATESRLPGAAWR